MSWNRQWSAISTRLQVTSQVLDLFTASGVQEKLAASNETLIPELRMLWLEVSEFRKQHGANLPAAASPILDAFLANPTYKKSFGEGGAIGLQGALLLFGALATVRAQFDYAMRDVEVVARRLVERAFVHLERSIVADKDFKTRWQNAFKDGETSCERQGAVHLLSHGLWAFKAHAQGGRTDLILGGPIPIDDARRTAEALVLTEWKCVPVGEDPSKMLAAAINQAERYSEETLAGFEIASRRYAVLVSSKALPGLPRETERNNNIYQTIVLPVDPDVPSVAATK